MNQAKHEDFRTAGVISLWLGNLRTEDDLDDYLDSEFEADFGFDIYPPDGPESDIAEDGPQLVEYLLEDFSRSDSFVEDAAIAAHKKGWDTATTALVFYNFKYDPKFMKAEASGKLVFIGSWPYGGSG